MVAAGRLYTVHGLWWVRRRGREGCRGVGEGGLFVLQHQHQHSRGREERGEMQGLPAQHRRRRRVFPRSVCKSTGSQSTDGRLWPAQCRSSRVKGAVSAQRWCHDLFWGSDVRPLQWGWQSVWPYNTCCTIQQHNKYWSEYYICMVHICMLQLHRFKKM